MSDDNKLVKSSVTVETTEAFAKAIGRAIEGNDVETAKVLSGELVEKLDVYCVCGHNQRAHSAKSNAELPNNGTGTCLATLSTTMRQCTCRGFVRRDALANVANKQPMRVGPWVEGKHFARLNSVDLERALNGEPYTRFRMTILSSQTMDQGDVTYLMPVGAGSQMHMAGLQLDRLGIDPDAISGMLNNLNMNVVVVCVKKWTKTGRQILAINLRLPDDTDGEFYGDNFGDMA